MTDCRLVNLEEKNPGPRGAGVLPCGQSTQENHRGKEAMSKPTPKGHGCGNPLPAMKHHGAGTDVDGENAPQLYSIGVSDLQSSRP